MNRLLSLFFQRMGYDAAFLDRIEQCNHPEPAHIDEMCDMLKHYHDEGTQIALLTDFDMDGLMSGVVGYAGLKELGFNVVLAHPDVATGYGFDAAEIDNIKKQFPEAAVLMTGDVGITAYEGIARARALGLEVLVTDHHIPKAKLVDANVIVDPQLPDDPAYSGICGAHVMYMVLRHYAREHAANPDFSCAQIDRLRVFAGFGTISDSMPMLYENRRLVRDALEICRSIYNNGDTTVVESIPGCKMYRRAFSGLYTMLANFAGNMKIDIDTIQEDFVGFYVAPTFNCIKRLNGSVGTAYSVFFGSHNEAARSMETLMVMNEERKERVANTYAEMCAKPSRYTPFLYVVDTTPGLCGLLAQNVCEDNGYPAVVVIRTDNGYRGSGRSPEWYPFLSNANGHDGWEAAGHEGAFGISIEDDAALEAFVAFIRKDAEQKKPAPQALSVQPDIVISTLGDGDVGIEPDVFKDFLAELNAYHPFGPGFEAPRIVLRFNPREKVNWKLIGDNNHVRATLSQGLDLVCFRQGYYFDGTIDGNLFTDKIEIHGKLELNYYNGMTTVQFNGALPQDILKSYQQRIDQHTGSTSMRGKRVKGQKYRVREIQSQCIHDGKEVWTPSIVEAFLKRVKREYQLDGKPNLIRWAWCLHDKDTYSEADSVYTEKGFFDPFNPEAPLDVQLGTHKPDHIHLVLEFKNAVYNTSLQKKTNPELPIGCFRPPEALYDKFMAIATYLSHMRVEEQAKGKHRYSDDEIHCEFDYAEEVNKYLRKKEKLNKMKSQSPRGLADQFINKIEAGELRLEEAKARAKEIKGYSFFLRYEKEFKSARMEYIKRGYEMMPRINFYICGLSGAGKSTLSKWLAKALFPNLEDYECYYTVGAAGVRFDEYEYQPVIIWEDVRGNELAKEYGPEGILNLMEPKPKKRSYNIKFGKITLTHQVNIITTTQPFEEFSEQVMGRNKGRNQTTQEDIEQLYRRIPVMIEISHNDIDIYRNDRAFNPQSSLKSDYKKYAVITDCSIAQLNNWWDAAPIESAIATITEPMVELNNEFMEKMGPSGEKPSNEMDAPTFNVVKGADIQRLEWEFRQSYLTICERILTDCAYDFMPADIDFPEITMFGPYKPEPGWTLGDKFGEGPFYGVHCPFTYAQWKKMGRPMRYDNGQLYKEPYHADHERAETALEYGPYDDERTPAWVNEYKKALSAATEKYCKTKRLDDLQAWTSNLFGPHSRKDIKRVAEAWQCLVESWKTVRACFLESNECSIETTWYTTFQDLSSHCAKH